MTSPTSGNTSQLREAVSANPGIAGGSTPTDTPLATESAYDRLNDSNKKSKDL